MKRRLIMGLVLLIVLALGVMAVAEGVAPMRRKVSGPRMLTAEDLSRPVNRLNLTEEQREQLKKLQTEHFTKNQQLREELQALHFELRQLSLEQNPDQNLMKQKINRFNELRKEMYELRTSHQNSCRSLLTEEQLTQLNSYRQNGGNGRRNNTGTGRGRGQGGCRR